MERRVQRFMGIFLAFVILGVLAACGSGGGGAVGTTTPAVVHTLTGTYHGSFTGVVNDPSRTWVMTINEDMTVTGYGSNTIWEDLNGNGIVDPGELVNERLTGTITNGTDFTGKADGGCELTGKVDLTTGVFSGTWQIPNSNPSVSGTFSGTK